MQEHLAFWMARLSPQPGDHLVDDHLVNDHLVGDGKFFSAY